MTADGPVESGPLLSPGFWLHHAALTWQAELDSRLRPLGLTHTQFMLLASASWLAHVGGPPTQQAVAAYTGADRMMTSRVIRTLETRGLLRRAAHESDGRAVRLHLTPEGTALAARAVAVAQAVDTLFFGTDPAGLRRTFRAVVDRRVPATASNES